MRELVLGDGTDDTETGGKFRRAAESASVAADATIGVVDAVKLPS